MSIFTRAEDLVNDAKFQNVEKKFESIMEFYI